MSYVKMGLVRNTDGTNKVGRWVSEWGGSHHKDMNIYDVAMVADIIKLNLQIELFEMKSN